MIKIVSLTASALVIASSLYVGPAAASVLGAQEAAPSSQTIVAANGCGWGRHWSWRWRRCVRNW